MNDSFNKHRFLLDMGGIYLYHLEAQLNEIKAINSDYVQLLKLRRDILSLIIYGRLDRHSTTDMNEVEYTDEDIDKLIQLHDKLWYRIIVNQ